MTSTAVRRVTVKSHGVRLVCEEASRPLNGDEGVAGGPDRKAATGCLRRRQVHTGKRFGGDELGTSRRKVFEETEPRVVGEGSADDSAILDPGTEHGHHQASPRQPQTAGHRLLSLALSRSGLLLAVESRTRQSS